MNLPEKDARRVLDAAVKAPLVNPAPIRDIIVDGRKRTTRRRMQLIGGAFAACLALGLVGVGASSILSRHDLQGDYGSLTPREYGFALAAARRQLEANPHDHLTGAHAAIVDDPDVTSSADASCSASVLRVTLVASFPDMTVLPAAGRSSEISAMLIDLDPQTGNTCQVGASTEPVPSPSAGSADLLPDLK